MTRILAPLHTGLLVMPKGSVEDGLRNASRKRGKIKLTAGDFGGSTASAGRNRSSRTPLDKRLLGWGEGVVARLHHVGVFAKAEAVADPDGCRLVLASEGCSHARVVLAVGARGLDVRVDLPDDRALRGHMLRHARELFAALESLPEEFTIGTAKEQGRTARTSTLDEVNALLDKTGLARQLQILPQSEDPAFPAIPDCLNSPKGANGSWPIVLTSTRPAASLRATRFARSGSA